MTVSSIKVKVQRKALVKLKVLPKFPANIEALNFLTITRSGNSYTFSVDYSVLTPGPISDPTTAYVAIEDATAGVYRTVTLSSLLTSGLDADLQAIAALTGTGILARTASNTWVLRTITGTANEITVTNGDGVSGAPTLSLPAALTFTGKTVTGGTFTGVTITSASYSGTLAGGTGLPISTGVSGLGTGIATALGVNVGTAGAPVINGGVLGTPSSGTATNITGLPISTGVSGLAAGAATFLATPSSANLRALLTDEVGTGAAYFVGGALGTPASGTATNLTGLPLSTGITGAGTGVLTALGVNVGTAGSAVVNGGVLGTPSSGTATNLTGLPLSGLTTQGAFTLVGNNTGSSAVPTAVDIALLTTKASPAAGDYVILSDQAASGAWKKATVSSVGSAGSVSSYNTRTGAVTATGTDIPLRGYLSGLTLSTAGSSQVFSIAAGVCTDSTNVSMMALAAFTKTAVGGGTWVVGTGNSVLDTGAYSTNTWYHVFIIQRPDTGLVDVLISLSATSPTLPTNYTLFRRIGAIRSGSVAGQWVLFHQLGDVFLWDTPPTDINTATLGTSATSFTLSVPGGVQVDATIAGYINIAGAGNAVSIWSPDAANLGSIFHAIASVSSVNFSFPPAPVRTNTSSQIKAVSTTSSTSMIVGTISWIDRRGRDA